MRILREKKFKDVQVGFQNEHIIEVIVKATESEKQYTCVGVYAPADKIKE